MSVCQSTGPWVCCVLCGCVCMYDIESEYQQKTTLCVRPQWTWCLVAWYESPSGSMIPRLSMCRSIITLSKIAHQMWHDHPLSQTKKTAERAGLARGLDKIWKRGKALYGSFYTFVIMKTICASGCYQKYH